jgi:hypothetical protein
VDGEGHGVGHEDRCGPERVARESESKVIRVIPSLPGEESQGSMVRDWRRALGTANDRFGPTRSSSGCTAHCRAASIPETRNSRVRDCDHLQHHCRRRGLDAETVHSGSRHAFPVHAIGTQNGVTLPGLNIAISPDSTKLVYVSESGQLFLRQMSEVEARPIGPDGATNPFFSPDGKWVGFISRSESEMKKIAITGGAAIRICKFEATQPLGPSWEDDQIVFGDPRKGIMRVSANGGEPEILVGLKAEEGSAYAPQILDSSRAVLFTLTPPGGFERDQAQIVVQLLRSGERKVVVRAGTDAHYVPSGHIVYALGGNVLAAPFDLKRLEVKGGSVPVVEGVMRAQGGGTNGLAHLALSDNGALVYRHSDGTRVFFWKALAASHRRNRAADW